MPTSNRLPPFKVFLSYSHEDEDLCNSFLKHLSQLERDGLIEQWNDRSISPGAEWAGEIDENLNTADVVILMVSASFLNSKYCNDVEMTRALERRQKGETLVVPVIIRPCDWETSRFGKLQALPKGGKPVVDWKTLDHGFLDAEKSLRTMITALCGSAKVRAQIWTQSNVRRHPLRWAAAVALLSLSLLCGLLWWASRRYLKESAVLLNVGRYFDAQPALLTAVRLNPLNRTARCGLRAVDADKLREQPDLFDQSVKVLNSEYPHCAYAKLLDGDRLYAADHLDDALVAYQDAVKREPQLAEAYFNMGRIQRRKGDLEAALEQYENAARISPRTPRYQNNLGALYFRLGRYNDAINAYGHQFPLSALESGKIYRLQGDLDRAAEQEESAIALLKQTEVKKAEDDYAWAIDDGPDKQLQLASIDAKECYAQLEFAVTNFLKNGEAKSAVATSDPFAKCSGSYSQTDLKCVLRWELHRLSGEVHDFTQGSDVFVERFLHTSSPCD
jgi:tetratricopeptide (TPR) repeat protein